MNEEYFRYFIGNNDGKIYRINVNKKNNLYKESMVWHYREGNWEIIDSMKYLGSWRKKRDFYHVSCATLNNKRYLEAVRMVKNTRGEYIEGTWDDIILELL